MTCAQIQFAVSTAVAVILLTWAGNLICKAVLDWSGLSKAMQSKPPSALPPAAAAGPAPAPSPSATPPPLHPRVGHLIGAFERSLIAIGLLAGSWEILVAVVALKTVARFKELDEKLDAEYFLVGSMFSLIWAVVVTLSWAAYDHCYGLDIAVRWQSAFLASH